MVAPWVRKHRPDSDAEHPPPAKKLRRNLGEPVTMQAGDAQMEHQPTAKKLRPTFGETVTVQADDPLKPPFFIHKDILCSRSPFFKAACNQRWTAGKDKTVTIPEHSYESLQLYFSWLYDRTTNLRGDARQQAVEGSRITVSEVPFMMLVKLLHKESIHNLARAWLFGDYVGDNGFKNTVMAAILRTGHASALDSQNDSDPKIWYLQGHY